MLTFHPPTTLQLAEAIAQAVSRWEPSPTQPLSTPATQVLDTLRQYHCWFCHLTAPQGATEHTTLPPAL